MLSGLGLAKFMILGGVYLFFDLNLSISEMRGL